VITAGYLLYMLQRVLMGPANERLAGVLDINKRELLTLIPLLALVIVVRVYPLTAIKYQMVSLEALIRMLGGVSF